MRSQLRERMEAYGIDKVNSSQITVTYTPGKTVMQFDSQSFRAENEEPYPAIAGQSKEKCLSLSNVTTTWNKARTDKKYVESTQVMI